MGMQKGHYGKYTGNAKWSMDHAHTKVTKENYMNLIEMSDFLMVEDIDPLVDKIVEKLDILS